MNSGWLAWECIVFAVFVCASSCAPLWGRRKDASAPGGAKRAYIFAGGGVSTLAMILSVSRGTLGVRSFLGFPSELVYYGTAMWETLYGMVLAFPLVCWIFIPVYYRLQTNSVYEYLQMRFGSHWVRRIAAATFLVRQVLNLAVTVYTPTVALHAVMGLPHWASAAALTIVAVVFNLLGGLAAAIRADVIQTITMVLVSGAFIVQATIKAGGPQQVLEDNLEGGRLKFLQFHWDPTVRVDTVSALFGQLFMSVSIYGCQQTFVQRYCSMSSESRVRRTLLANVPAVAVLFSLSWVVGMALYALYQHCDPLLSGKIAAPDEVLAFYVQDQFGFLPGMLGLFLGSIFNGALSFMVSNVNSLATVMWEDFVSAAPAFRDIGDKQQLTVIKVIGVLFAVLIMSLSLCVGMVGGVVESALLVTSATSGALLGVFLLAALFPVANGKGAAWGMLTSHAITTWMAIGRILYVNKTKAMLPLLVDQSLIVPMERDLLVTSATSGSLLGVFLLSALFPVANGKEAAWGMLTSHAITTSMAIGRILYVNKTKAMLPLFVDQCPAETQSAFNSLPIGVNQTLMKLAPLLQQTTHHSKPQQTIISSALISLYSVSYMWYAVIGTVSCIIIGIIIGALTAKDSDAFDERLLHPLAAKIARKLPGTKRTFTIENKEDSEKTVDTVVEDIKVKQVTEEVKKQVTIEVLKEGQNLKNGTTPPKSIVPQKTKI